MRSKSTQLSSELGTLFLQSHKQFRLHRLCGPCGPSTLPLRQENSQTTCTRLCPSNTWFMGTGIRLSCHLCTIVFFWFVFNHLKIETSFLTHRPDTNYGFPLCTVGHSLAEQSCETSRDPWVGEDWGREWGSEKIAFSCDKWTLAEGIVLTVPPGNCETTLDVSSDQGWQPQLESLIG